MRRKPIIFSVVVLFVFVMTLIMTPVLAQQDLDGLELIQSDQRGLTFRVIVPDQSLIVELIKHDSHIFSKISLTGWDVTSQAGAPQLPFRAVPIAVPDNVALSVNIIPEKSHEVYLDAPVVPGVTQKLSQISAGNDNITDSSLGFSREKDPQVYGSLQVYPGDLAAVVNDGFIRDQRTASIGLYPVQYDPQTKMVTVHESFLIEIIFNGYAAIEQKTQNTDDQIFTRFFEKSLLNYEDLKCWKTKSDEFSPNGVTVDAVKTQSSTHASPWLPPDPSWRIKINQDGFYRLTYTELLNAGVLDSSPDPRNFQIYYRGEPVAIQVRGEDDGVFNADDLILFFGESVDNKYTDENVYWLTVEDFPGFRISERTGKPAVAQGAEYFTNKKYFEENNSYWSLFPGEDDIERFYWNHLNNFNQDYFNREYIFSLTNKFPGEARLTLSLVGYSDTAHNFQVYLNETEVTSGEISWEGRLTATFEFDVTETLLPGDNILKLTCTSDSSVGYDTFLIDWYQLEFPNSFKAEADKLHFDYDQSGSWLFTVDNFSSDQITVFDVTDPTQSVEIVNTTIYASGEGNAVNFEDKLSSAKRYIAVCDSGLNTVVSIVSDQPSNLQSISNQADYILITPDDFWEETLTLTDYRESQGLSVMPVRLQDIYDEFNGGVFDANAIRDFLQYAYQNWQAPVPSYVMLVGDGHYDPKDHLGYGRTSYIPPYLAVVDPWIGETAADNRYVAVSGEDTMPDMIIGRLSVNSPAEAQMYIDKIIAYEQSFENGDWLSNVLAVADNADSGGNYPLCSDNIINDYIPESYVVDRLYYGVTHTTAESARSALKSSYDSGVFLMNYIGHAYKNGWASESLLTTGDVPLLENASKQPVVLAMTCWEGFFHQPHPLTSGNEALGEVVTRANDRGAIASWSPAGLGIATGHDYLNRGFYEALFQNKVDTIGEAIFAGKLNLWLTGSNLDLLDTFMLFGDPATNFARSLMAVNDAYQVNENETLNISNVEEGVLANDINPEGAMLEAVLVDNVSNGLLTLNSDGTFTYTPNPDYSGMDSFTYKANDGSKDSNIATVTITVTEGSNIYTYLPLVFR